MHPTKMVSAEAEQTAATATAPESITFKKMSEEARQVLAEARSCAGAVSTSDGSVAGLTSAVVVEAERFRIVLRISRVLSWIALESALQQGHFEESDISLTLGTLFECSALRELPEGVVQSLPPEWWSLTQRSLALLERAERLGSRD